MPKNAAPRSLRLPQSLSRAIEIEARRTGRSFSAVATEMLEEASRTRKFRHIVFRGPPGRRRAAVVGSGLDVWEVVRDYRALDQSRKRLGRRLHWVSREAVDEALAYAGVYAEEIDERLAREAHWTEPAIREALPWSSPDKTPG
ncbi:MAG TPA: hypothetical protein VGA37_02515 [Gemmatimonadales bacterium]